MNEETLRVRNKGYYELAFFMFFFTVMGAICLIDEHYEVFVWFVTCFSAFIGIAYIYMAKTDRGG